ncbi:MAG: hypothetical protein KME64_22705 [Scytonematopsis contorta HA4267-MV1]|jgi:hypothetical protein|nr:hypothetical protein [Scytonematopsis contorta HA4267-MV1]
MTTVIFVHGTGVRKLTYEETFEIIKEKIKVEYKRPDVTVESCLWGDEFGATLA